MRYSNTEVMEVRQKGSSLMTDGGEDDYDDDVKTNKMKSHIDSLSPSSSSASAELIISACGCTTNFSIAKEDSSFSEEASSCAASMLDDAAPLENELMREQDTSASPNNNDNSFPNFSWKFVWTTLERKRQESLITSSPSTYSSPRSKWQALLFGQAISLLATSCNASTFTISFVYNLQIQMFLMFPMYCLLSICLWFRPAITEHEDCHPVTVTMPSIFSSCSTSRSITFFRLRAKWWIYFLYSFFDVFPNFMALMSLRYTTLTSTTLLESMSVVSTMFFSKWILGRWFKGNHFLGVALCVVGGLLTIYADLDAAATNSSTGQDRTDPNDSTLMLSSDHTEGTSTLAALRPRALLGDLMAITSALSYGLCDSTAEFLVKHVDKYEYLGMVGVFGAVWTGLLFPFLNGPDVYRLFFELPWGEFWSVMGVLLWYNASAVLYYLGDSTFFERSDATLLNLNIQTANLWAIAFSIVLYHMPPPPVFYIAVVCVTLGVISYDCQQPSTYSSLTGSAPTSAFSESDDHHTNQELHNSKEILLPHHTWLTGGYHAVSAGSCNDADQDDIERLRAQEEGTLQSNRKIIGIRKSSRGRKRKEEE